MGTKVVLTEWGWAQMLWGRDGDVYSVHRDKRGLGSVSVPVQTSTTHKTKFTTIFATFRTKRKQIRLYVVDNYYDSFLPPGI